MEEHTEASGGSGLSLAGEDEPLLLELLHDHGDRWQITRGVSPVGWVAVPRLAPDSQQLLAAPTLAELSDILSRHKAEQTSATGDTLPPGFVRAVLDDARLTDLLMDALEARVAALEEVAAARGIRRLSTAWRLGRSLRGSVRHFTGHSFTERRREAASTEWG
jgi:hypothetical protein